VEEPEGGWVDDDEEARRRAIIDSYKVVCLCNKIRKGLIEKAIKGGAHSFDDVKRRTRAGTGPCGAKRCGPVIRDMLTKK
jgi:NAD(P)H-nitrite reductase large subunit